MMNTRLAPPTGSVSSTILADADVGQMDDQSLEQRASTGDHAAATEFLSRHLRMLSAMSRRLSMNVVEPEDLLADAITNLFQRWKRGDGPREQVKAYLITSMRNRVTDELRSPRSRTISFDPTLPHDAVDREADSGTTYESMDLYREFGWARQALARLSDEQRQFIVGTVIEGRKSGDLAAETSRSSAAAYTVNHRAKLALRRAMLQVMLDEDADPDCASASKDLPPTVGETPATTPEGTSRAHHASLDHIRSCDRCRLIWARFSAIGITLGITPLVVAADVLGVTAPVAGASASALTPPPSQKPQSRRPRWGRFSAPSWPVVAAGVVASAMVATGIAVTTTSVQDSAAREISGHLSSTTTAVGRTMEVALVLDIDGESVRSTSLHLALPAGTQATLGAGWVCEGTTSLTCSSSTVTWPAPVVITVTPDRRDLLGGTWTCELDGYLESGVRFVGTIRGEFPAQGIGVDSEPADAG